MDTETLSTTIDTDPGPSAAGAGVPKLAEPVNDARDDVAAAFKEADEAAKVDEKPVDKPDDKPKVDEKSAEKAVEKPEAKADDKAAEKAPVKDAEKPDAEPDDSKDEKAEQKSRHPDAPSKFLPRAKELWRNTPNEVKAEVDRVLREHGEEVGTLRKATERYEAIREFDELAQRNGRDLRDSLTRINQIENMMQANPIAGLNAILMEVGPRKADGQPFSLMEVAQFLQQQGPQGYQQIVSRQPQQQQQQAGNPEVEQLKQQIEQMQIQQASREIVEPFKAAHPRYDELQEDIAFFLQSGKIPAGLSPSDRLAAAYDMAERINPSSSVRPATDDEPPTDRRADTDFGGSAKSIKSSPGSVSEDVDVEAPANESIADSIRKAMRRQPA